MTLMCLCLYCHAVQMRYARNATQFLLKLQAFGGRKCTHHSFGHMSGKNSYTAADIVVCVYV
jgi:hypothetical protein